MRRPFSTAALFFTISLGCSSDVDQVDGTGGSGAGTTSSATTSATTSGATTAQTTTVQSSSSTGMMGNTCEQGCAHIDECGFVGACRQIGVDCQDPQTECPMACVLEASCEDLQEAFIDMNPPPELAACIQACGGGEGGGGEGGGMQQGCGGCTFQNDCLDGCFGDPDCQDWAMCAQGCSDPMCFDDCEAMHPNAEPFYTAIYACQCQNCEMECATEVDPCNQQGGGFGGAGGN